MTKRQNLASERIIYIDIVHIRSEVDDTRRIIQHSDEVAVEVTAVNLHYLCERITDLRIDEYIYAIYFLDETLNVLDELNFYGKFSYRKVNQVLQNNPNIRYVELDTAYVSWGKRNPNKLKLFTLARRMQYDLQKQRMVAEETF
jgi:hypothetical protein